MDVRELIVHRPALGQGCAERLFRDGGQEIEVDPGVDRPGLDERIFHKHAPSRYARRVEFSLNPSDNGLQSAPRRTHPAPPQAGNHPRDASKDSSTMDPLRELGKWKRFEPARQAAPA